MNRQRNNLIPFLTVLLLLPALLACSLSGSQNASPTDAPPAEAPPAEAPATQAPATQALATQAPATQAPATQAPATQAPATQAPATQAPEATITPAEAAKPIRQWAYQAEASSEYGSYDWAAFQATGAPDTPECGDYVTAWASATASGIEWINLYFQRPVYASEVHVIETYNPDQVVRVDLIDMQGDLVTVYTAEPVLLEDPCPYTLSILLDDDELLVQGVRVTLDESAFLDWTEIDAVEIVGLPGEGSPVRPPTPTP